MNEKQECGCPVRRSVILWLPLVVLVGFLLYPNVSGQLRGGSDIDALHLPFRALYADSLSHGEMPLWAPQLFSGYRLFAQGEIGGAHPVHLFLYRIASVHTAMSLEIALSYIVAYIGMVMLLSLLGFGLRDIIMGCICFTISIFMSAHYVHLNMVAVWAHVPLICSCLVLYSLSDCRRRRMLSLLGVALLLASQILLGHPPAFYLSTICCGVLCISVYGLPWKRTLLSGALAVILALMIGSVQWMTTLDVVAESARAVGKVDFVNMYSLHPLNLLQLFSPYLYAGHTIGDSVVENSVIEFSIFPAQGLLLLALWTVCRPSTSTRERRCVCGVVAVILVCGWLMLGRYGGLNQLTSYIPILKGIRVPSRYIAVCLFGLLALGLYGLKSKGTETDSTLLRRVAVVILGLDIVVLLIAMMSDLIPDVNSQNMLIVSFATVALSCACCISKANLSSRKIRMLMCCIVCETLAASSIALLGITDLVPASPVTVASMKSDTPRQYRVMGDWNWKVADGAFNVVGYSGVEPEALPLNHKEVAELMSVNRALNGADEVQVSGALPRFRLIRLSMLNAEQRRNLVNLSSLAYSTAMMVKRDDAQYQNIQIETQEDVLLIVADRWHKNWNCEVNGHEVEIRNMYNMIRGIKLGPGKHIVEFRYQSSIYILGRWISAVGALIALCLASYTAVLYVRRRRELQSSS
jgi:hypothetical protein